MRSGISLALSHQRMAVKRRACRRRSRPQAGGAGRAEGASLDGRRLVRQRLDMCGCLGNTHCADLLSAKENLDSCNVRRCLKSCDKSLHCHTTDRGAPCAFYPAGSRSLALCSLELVVNCPTEHDIVGTTRDRIARRSLTISSRRTARSACPAVLRRSCEACPALLPPSAPGQQSSRRVREHPADYDAAVLHL